jgi:CubicO group peptidase (beta-lactamase class C family)
LTLSGESYADYIQNHIFDPLEMSHSYTSQAVAQQHGLAVGHRYWFAFPFAVPNLPIPRGSLNGRGTRSICRVT